MPATRRTSGSRASNSSGGKQSTLSFHGRVTKGAVPKSAKGKLATTPNKPSPLAKHVSSIEDPVSQEKDVEAAEDVAVELEGVPEVVKSESELRAKRINEKQINKYWRNLEKERKAKRVHQEDLSTGEKVLRYFDVSSQYGPCVGIDRLKRWQRADLLGLDPPIEVLAVLLNKTDSSGTAHMDYILNSTAVGST